MTLWSDDKTNEDIQRLSETDSDSVVYNLHEDLLCVKEQLAKANERLRELEKNSKDSFVSFAKKHNTVDGSTALFIHALAVAFDKEQLRKEQNQC